MSRMPVVHRDLIVVGASAGGVEALRALAAGLPADLPAAVVVVLHLPAGGTSALPQILDRSGPLPAVAALAGMPLTPGRIHVAPPDHHLLIVDDQCVLSHGPTENGHRPAVDALFRSAAVAAGPRVTGVVLSGTLDDGVAGLVAIRGRGGAVVVQDPADALYTAMPENALRHAGADQVVSAAAMGEVLASLATRPVNGAAVPAASARLVLENDIVRSGDMGKRMLGQPSEYSCPDCHGVLNELEPLRYRCQVGHAWSAEALAQAQGDTFERAVWAGLRSLEEKAGLSRRMLDMASTKGDSKRAERYREQIEEADLAADVLRRFLISRAAPQAAQDRVPDAG